MPLILDRFRAAADSAALRRLMHAETGGVALLAFSGGKDAVGAWIALREAGFRVIPYHLYLVPGLSFVEEALAAQARHFGEPIRQLPHPSLIRMLREAVYQPPDRAARIERLDLPALTYADVWAEARRREGLPPDAWIAQGVRQNDSLQRRASIKRFGAAKASTRNWYPIYDWRVEALSAALRRDGAPLGVEYAWFGRSFDGIDRRFLLPIKQHRPDDYRRICEWFPLAELEVVRAEMVERASAEAARRRREAVARSMVEVAS
jgi:hypothetical protein